MSAFPAGLLSSRQSARPLVVVGLALAGSLLAGCDRLPAPTTPPAGVNQAAPAPAAPASPAAPAKAPAAAPRLVAEWRSFAIAPPTYNLESLQVFDDGTFMLIRTREQQGLPGRWKRGPKDTLQLVMGNDPTVYIASLLPPRKRNGQAGAATASYLTVTLGGQQPRNFVRLGTPDDAMVRAAVAGEFAWQQGRPAEAFAQLRRAVAAGDDHARVRLAWRLATTRGLLQPEEAVVLLEPLAGARDYGVQNARAAALAAAGRFDEAVQVAGAACALAPADAAGGCAERLAGYREKRPVLLDPFTPPAPAAAAGSGK